MVITRETLLKQAYVLALITILYNTAEGLISVYLGAEDKTLSLLGFGIDSFVEVISGIGIWHMLVKIKIHGYEEQDVFEKTALKITGSSFYILVIGLSFTALYNIITNHQPETTYWGIVISLISIVTMALLIFYKNKVGQSLNSKALITDANCTKTCLYLSIILLAASVGYQLTGIGYLDSAGAMAISYFSFMEGKEAFEKARTGKNCTCENGN